MAIGSATSTPSTPVRTSATAGGSTSSLPGQGLTNPALIQGINQIATQGAKAELPLTLNSQQLQNLRDSWKNIYTSSTAQLKENLGGGGNQ